VSASVVHVGTALVEDLHLDADVVIVGTGAGGGVAAEILTGAGLRVVMVEEGKFRKPEQVPMLGVSRACTAKAAQCRPKTAR